MKYEEEEEDDETTAAADRENGDPAGAMRAMIWAFVVGLIFWAIFTLAMMVYF